jgi:hypothetical protein
MEVVFNFGGFYNSIYDDAINDVVYEDDVENTIEVDAVDFKTLHIEVAKHITEQFIEYIDDEFGVEVKFEFDSLDSPRFYNYSTDTINLNISDADRVKLDKLVIENEDVEDILKGIVDDTTTSKPGYIPFYNYEDVMAKIDEDNTEVYYQSLLDALIDYDKGNYENTTLESLSETIYQNI